MACRRCARGLDGAVGDLGDYESLLAAAAPLDGEVDVDDDDTTILMFTSGTTSLPKGVMLTFGDFSAYVTANVELADGTPRGAALLCAPLYHIAGVTNMMTTLWTGRRLVVMAQFEARAWLDLVERERITHAFVVPTMLKHVLDQPDLDQRDLASLEVLAYGGAPMPFPVIRRAIERLPASVGFVNAFDGPETTSTLTCRRAEDHRLDGGTRRGGRTLRPCGRSADPCPDVEVRISSAATVASGRIVGRSTSGRVP
jgi:acyl-CoA synthetase (AMP-forming)/AMP-acid ligase II